MEFEFMEEGNGGSTSIQRSSMVDKGLVLQCGGNEGPFDFKAALLKKPTACDDQSIRDWSDDDVDLDGFETEDIEVQFGIPNLRLSKQERKQLWRPQAHALIVKVIGKFLPYNFLIHRLQTRWRNQGDLRLIDIGNGYYLAKLPTLEDCLRMLSEGPSVIAGHYLSIQAWRSEFDPLTDRICRMAIWVRLPYLPFEYYNRSILAQIGKLIGRTLKIDNMTEMANRGKFARLGVLKWISLSH